MSGEITLTATFHRHAYLEMPAPQQAYVLIEAMPTANAPAAAQPVNFGLVLDRSGSMAGEKLRNLQMAAKAVIDRLGPNDRISIIIFDERADVIVPAQLVNDRDTLKKQIDRIQERGGTKMSSGMEAGLTQLQAGVSANSISRMLLLTDGQTWEDAALCESLAERARMMGVPLSVMGLGVGTQSDWDPRFLENLAQRSGGEWDIIDTPDKVSAIFEKTLTNMQGSVTSNANLTLRLAADVKPRNVWRVTPLISKLDHRSVTERDVQVFLGEIQHGVGQSLLADVLIPVRKPGTYRMIQADIGYDVPAANLSAQKANVEAVITYTADAAAAAQIDPRLMNIIERVQAHKLQTQALDESAAGQKQNATKRLRAAATQLLELGETEMAQNALNHAQQLEQGGPIDPAEAQRLRYQTKRLTENLTN